MIAPTSSTEVPETAPVIIAASLLPLIVTLIVSLAVPSNETTSNVSTSVSPELRASISGSVSSTVYVHSPVNSLNVNVPYVPCRAALETTWNTASPLSTSDTVSVPPAIASPATTPSSTTSVSSEVEAEIVAASFIPVISTETVASSCSPFPSSMT